MNKEKSRWFAVCLLLLSFFALFANGSGDAKQEDVVLSYAMWDSNQAKQLQIMVDEFEAANPGIKIEIQVNGWGDYWDSPGSGSNRKRHAGYFLDAFPMKSFRYASNGLLLDLTSKIQSSSDVSMGNFPEGLVSIYNYEGKQFRGPERIMTR